MDIVNARPDLVGVPVFLERFEQLRARARILDGNHVGVHPLDHPDDVVELAVAHVRVDLGGVLHAARRQPEGVHRPLEVVGPLGPAQRQPLPERRLVDLDDPDSGLLEVQDFLPDRKRELLRGLGPGLVVAHEGPLEHRHRPGQHALHGLGGLRLRERAPAHRHRPRARHVAVDDRRLDVARAVGLHPPVLGEREALELFTEVLHHVVALELAVHQHVQPELCLDSERAGDLVRDERIVLLGRELPIVELAPRRPHLGGLRERPDRGRREEGQGDLLLPARLVRRPPPHVLFRHTGRAPLHRRVMDAPRGAPRRQRARVRLEPGGDAHRLAPLAQRPGQRHDLFELLLGERQPPFELGIKPRLGVEVERYVQQRARRGHPQIFSADPVPRPLEQRERRSQIGLPDVPTVDHAERQDPALWEGVEQRLELARSAYQIHVQPRDRQLPHRRQGVVQSRKVRREQDPHPGNALGDQLVGADVRIPTLGRAGEREARLVDLYPPRSSRPEPRKDLGVDRQQRVEQVEPVEARLAGLPQ